MFSSTYFYNCVHVIRLSHYFLIPDNSQSISWPKMCVFLEDIKMCGIK